MRYSLVLLFCFFICTSACNKKSDSNTLPPPTQSGQNILACTVNGSVHIYQGKGTSTNPIGVGFTYSPTYGFVGFSAGNKQKYNDDLGIYLDFLVPMAGQVYKVRHNYSYSVYDNYNNINHPQYFMDTSKSTVTFTRFDSLVAAGTFNLVTEKDSFHSDTFNIVGYFDIMR